MDVHSFQQFKPGLKDAVAHHLHHFYITVLHWIAALGPFLQNSLPSFHLKTLVALVKINLWTPLLGFKRQFSLEEYLNPIKTKSAHALDSVSRLSLNRISTYQFSWPNLASLRTTASDLTRAFAAVFRSVFRHYIRGGLTWVRSCLSWLGSFKDTTPHFVRSVTHSIPDVELLGTTAIENISFVGRHVKGSYGGRNLRGIAFSGLLGVGTYLEDYAKDHWKAATDTASSMLVMMADIASFSMNGVFCFKNTTMDHLFDHGKAAMDTRSSMLEMVADAASFITKALASLKGALTNHLFGHFKVAVDSMLGMTSSVTLSSVRGLVGLIKKAPSRINWINGAADISHRCFEPTYWVVTTCAAPMVAMFRCLLNTLAAFIDFSENLFQTLVDFGQDWIMRWLDILIDRKLECGLFVALSLLAFKVFTFSRQREQARGPLTIARRVLVALGYFLKAPLDTILITILVAMYLLLAVKGLIRFSLLDMLRLESIVRLNTMPGAWVNKLDEDPCKGLFRSTLQLQRPPQPTTFSSLPNSIRSRIYQLALTDKNGFKWDNRMKTLRSNLSPSLLRVSHDTRRSTLAIPFNMNKVLIDSCPERSEPSIPKELQRHLLPQPQPCGREQLLDLLTSLRIPPSPPTQQHTKGAHESDTNDTSATAPLPRLGALLATTRSPWIIDIREPYAHVWAFDIRTIISHLPLVPSLVVNYTITIPPGAPRPLSKAQHLARQLRIAAHQGHKDARFRVYVEGLENWETLAMLDVLARGKGAAGCGVEGGDGGGGGEGGEAAGFLCEGETDLMREVAKVERAVDEMNSV